VLESSTPRDAAVVGTAPTSVALVFDEAVGKIGAAATLTGPSGTAASGPVSISGRQVTVPVSASGAGSYRLAWRVVSDDGHPVTGTVRWTVRGVAGGSPASTPVAAPAGQSAGSTGSWLSRHGGHLVVAWAVIVVGVAYLGWDALRRRHRTAVRR
jgi:methionine-rich copper-binding protein CopC